MDRSVPREERTAPPCYGILTRERGSTLLRRGESSTLYASRPTGTGCVPPPRRRLRFGIWRVRLLWIPSDPSILIRLVRGGHRHIALVFRGLLMEVFSLLAIPITSFGFTRLFINA